MKKKIWIAIGPRGGINAAWWRGCVQPFRRWRKTVIGLGWKPVHSTISY